MEKFVELRFNQIQSEDSEDLSESLDKAGSPVFEPDDIFSSPHFLTQLLRAIYIKRGITREMFKEMHREYAIKHLGFTHKQAENDRGNLLKPMKIGPVTPQTFQKALRVIGLVISDVSITLLEIDNGTTKYTLSELKDEIMNTKQNQ